LSFFNPNTTLNCNGRLVMLDTPKVMGILNLTPDSFYDGGKYASETFMFQVEKMIREGADFIDIGGMSSRPGATIISVEEELKRVLAPIGKIRHAFPDVIISIDTIHAEVAKQAVEHGALMVNDIAAGNLDENMLPTVGKLNVPYIAMHMKGRPENMQQQAQYDHVTLEVLDFFIDKVKACRAAGIKDVIVDPGFGFGKSIEHNYTLLQHLQDLEMLELPILVGLSRKSMISNYLQIATEDTLNATSSLHMVALQNGASILRVHDVKEAKQCIDLWIKLKRS
jgi:dihydropteroate synthase